ncbi:MAG TPA: hypothetical protein VGO61_15265 [Steroidobacteraceae bacterium]|nr:hypothetical protein [Steroidobacteraceae bacterium]
MASCAYCDTFILFGGKKHDDLRYCNAECEQKGVLARTASQMSPHEVSRRVAEVHQGDCPNCRGHGPVDVHTSYRVWSALFMTQWASRPAVCCQSCGTKKKLGDAAFSFFLGWWGFPWGLLMTPVQVVKNLGGLAVRPDPRAPTPALERMVRMELAAAALNQRTHAS